MTISIRTLGRATTTVLIGCNIDLTMQVVATIVNTLDIHITLKNPTGHKGLLIVITMCGIVGTMVVDPGTTVAADIATAICVRPYISGMRHQLGRDLPSVLSTNEMELQPPMIPTGNLYLVISFKLELAT